MIYPKKGPSTSSKEDERSKRSLNTQQRDELKKVMSDRLAKKYGSGNSELIRNEVDKYIGSSKTITTAAL